MIDAEHSGNKLEHLNLNLPPRPEVRREKQNGKGVTALLIIVVFLMGLVLLIPLILDLIRLWGN